jgi:hypothetical protein
MLDPGEDGEDDPLDAIICRAEPAGEEDRNHIAGDK